MMAALFALLALLAWFALIVAVWIRPVVDASRRPRTAYSAVGRTRMGTVWLILLSGWVGGAYYLVRIRPGLIAATVDIDRQPTVDSVPSPPGWTSPSLPQWSPASPSAGSSGPAGSEDRALFIRNIPPSVERVETIPLMSGFPPLGCDRQAVVDAVLELDPDVDTSQHRLTVMRPGLHITISFPLQDPLSEVLLRVRGDSDRRNADEFIGQLLTRIRARAFDTGSPTLVFSPLG